MTCTFSYSQPRPIATIDMTRSVRGVVLVGYQEIENEQRSILSAGFADRSSDRSCRGAGGWGLASDGARRSSTEIAGSI